MNGERADDNNKKSIPKKKIEICLKKETTTKTLAWYLENNSCKMLEETQCNRMWSVYYEFKSKFLYFCMTPFRKIDRHENHVSFWISMSHIIGISFVMIICCHNSWWLAIYFMAAITRNSSYWRLGGIRTKKKTGNIWDNCSKIRWFSKWNASKSKMTRLLCAWHRLTITS